jgi:cytochrome P450
MQLISDTVEVDRPKGPARAPRYPLTSPVNLADPAAFKEGPPYAAFAKLRAQAPVAWNEEPGERPGFWSVTRYEDVMRVNGDYETFSSQRGGILMSHQRSQMQLGRASLDAMINLDAPAHLQLRREHMPYFTPSYLRGLNDRVEAEVTRLLDEMAPLGKCDMVPSLSAKLPLFTLCEILGVPMEDRRRRARGRGRAGATGTAGLPRRLPRRHRRDVRIWPPHAAQAPARSAGRPDERNRPRPGGRGAARR